MPLKNQENDITIDIHLTSADKGFFTVSFMWPRHDAINHQIISQVKQQHQHIDIDRPVLSCNGEFNTQSNEFTSICDLYDENGRNIFNDIHDPILTQNIQKKQWEIAIQVQNRLFPNQKYSHDPRSIEQLMKQVLKV